MFECESIGEDDCSSNTSSTSEGGVLIESVSLVNRFTLMFIGQLSFDDCPHVARMNLYSDEPQQQCRVRRKSEGLAVH